MSCGNAHSGKIGTDWPDGLEITGYGFPDTGDPCRQLKKNKVIEGLADGLNIYAGCPAGTAEAVYEAIHKRYRAQKVGEYLGVTIIAIKLD